MTKFLLMHMGFEKPSPEDMKKWGAWFESLADCQVDQVGFKGGREISKDGTKDLPWDIDCITGFNVIEAESMEAAEKLAAGCPFIKGIRVYEMRSM